VPDDPRAHPSPRARPVADLAIDAVLARADELARRWAIALILTRPLAGIGEIPLEDLAREGPSLCAQVLRALHSDAELDRLTGRDAATGREQSAPARRLGAISGARDAADAAVAVEALRGVLWETLLDVLSWRSLDSSPARLPAEVADRLAHVCASSLAAAIAVPQASAPGLPLGEDDGDGEVAIPAREQAEHDARGGRAPRSAAVIVDERASLAGSTVGAQASQRPPVPRAGPRSGRPPSRDESAPAAARRAPTGIEIRDERGEEGPAAWIGSIGRQLERFVQDGLPFAVLLLELMEIGRLRRSEPPAELARLADQVERALASELRSPAREDARGRPRDEPGKAPRAGSLTRQSPGRYWLLAPETDRREAHDLAARLAQAVASSISYRGAPLEVAIGAAVCPEDGLQAPALAAHADVDLYAARSDARYPAGRPAASADEPA